jgi:hypothetical protein
MKRAVGCKRFSLISAGRRNGVKTKAENADWADVAEWARIACARHEAFFR